jgi:hypothetical protein
MNYRIILQDTLRLFRESKVLWIFGAIFFASEVVNRVSIYSIGEHPASCIPYPLVLVAVYFSLLAKVGLTYSVNRIMSNQILTFSEAWNFCKTKLKEVIGLYFIGILLIVLSVFIAKIVVAGKINVSLALFIGLLLDSFLNAWLTLSICTIVISNLEAGPGLWTGLLIVLHNFLHVIVLSSIFLILQIVLNWSIGNALPGIFLLVPLTVTMILAYRVFITKSSYPALSNIQPTA